VRTHTPWPRRLAALALALTFAPAEARALSLLYVAGSATLGDGDERVVFELERMGFTVDVFDDNVVQTADATGRDLVVVSSTVSSSAVAGKFTSVATPVLVRESSIYDDMGLTGPSNGIGFGALVDQSGVDAVGVHPLAAGLAGLVVISNQNEVVYWGVPGGEAAVGATVDGDPTRAASFGYEAGATMVIGSAPARRVGFFLSDQTAQRWTTDAQDLLRAAVRWATSAPAEDLVRVQPLGDSITSGWDTFWSYRRDLVDLLDADHCRVDFTGTRHGPKSGSPGDFATDRDHEGHSGFRTDEIEAGLAGWLVGNVPEIVLIHLGTNDVLEGTSLTDAKENLRAIIDGLRDVKPDVAILLAQIIPNRAPYEDAVLALNAHIADLAAEEDTIASPVVLVDQYTGYDSATQNFDKVHPNELGEQQIAQRWFAALRPLIDDHCGVPPQVPGLGVPGAVLLALGLTFSGFRRTRRGSLASG